MSLGELKKTCLYPQYAKSGGKLVEFGGWEMPLNFGSQLNEHKAVREKVGIFDVSHMGRFLFDGVQAMNFLLQITPAASSSLRPGKAAYSALLNPQGGIIDDLVIYTLTDDSFLMVVNGATKVKDWQWIQSQKQARPHLSFTCRDWSDELAMIAIQGPRSEKVIRTILPEVICDDLCFYEHISLKKDKGPFICARTGYTGEDGFEIIASNETIIRLWEQSLHPDFREADSDTPVKVTPCGLGARDSLRLEMAYPLYGSDINDSTTPVEAGLGWSVDWKRNDFIGAPVIHSQKKEGVLRRKLLRVKLLEKGIPRHDYPIVDSSGSVIGKVTSGGFSPVINQGIAMGYIEGPYIKEPMEPIFIQIRTTNVPAEIIKGSFVPAKIKRRPAQK